MIMMLINDKLKNIIRKLDINEYIKLVMLFGSRARGDYNKNSDFDIAILMEENYLDQINPLELRSELITRFTSELAEECDVVLINQATPLLKYQIVKYGEVIYITPEMGYSTFFSKVVKEHLDFKYYKKLHHDRMLKRLNGDGEN